MKFPTFIEFGFFKQPAGQMLALLAFNGVVDERTLPVSLHYFFVYRTISYSLFPEREADRITYLSDPLINHSAPNNPLIF